jgi:hypothetical protein
LEKLSVHVRIILKRGHRDVGSENIPSMNVAEARIRFLDVATITELLISL